MLFDSTCGYADREGFRCGTGDEFPVFNILTRKKLNIKERPLIIMEGTLQNFNYRGLFPNDVLKVFSYYIKITKKYKSKFTLLCHNSSFCEDERCFGFKNIYEKILKLLI